MLCVEAYLRYLTSFCNLHAPASPRIMAKATEPDNYRPGLVEWSTTKIIISFRVGQRDRSGGYPESAVQITG